MAGIDTPFDNAIVKKAGFEERPKLDSPTDKAEDGTESFGSVKPKPLPENTLKFGK